MKWGLVVAIVVSAILLACTDYGSEINEMHKDYLDEIANNAALSNASEPTSGSELVLSSSVYANTGKSSSSKAVVNSSGASASSKSSSSSVKKSSSSQKSSSSTAISKVTNLQWSGEKSDYRIETGLDCGEETSGYWYGYRDNGENGASTLTWPVALGNAYAEDALDPVIDYCHGLCANVVLDQGLYEYSPFVGVGFEVVGRCSDDKAGVADATGWNGICVRYTSSLPLKVHLISSDETDEKIKADRPKIKLPVTDKIKEVCRPWSRFKQDGYSGIKFSGEDAAQQLKNVHFQTEAADGDEGEFNIISLFRDTAAVIPCGDLWCGLDFTYRVKTRIDSNETSGYWYEYTDNLDGGESYIRWPVALGNKWDDEAKDPVIDDCAGFCGTINLAKGSLPDYYPPFVGVAFNVAGYDSKKDDLYTADVTKWGGVCVTYTSDIDIKFNLGLSKQDDALVKSDVARVILKSSKTPVQKCYQWKNFEQEGWGPEDGYAEISGPESAKKLASLRFQMQSDVVKTGKFNIISVGTYNKLYE